MATLATKLIERIDFHIEMIEEDIKDSINHAEKLSNVEAQWRAIALAETVAFDLKRIRNLKLLQTAIKDTGKVPMNLQQTLMGVMEEMMDLDI